MRYLILLTALLFGTIALSQSKYNYTFTIIDSSHLVITNSPIVVIYNNDTLHYTTNNEGQVTLNVKYTYPCTTGMRHGFFSNRNKHTSPLFGSGEITVIYNGHKGSFIKNWNYYFKQPKHLQKDSYLYDKKELISSH